MNKYYLISYVGSIKKAILCGRSGCVEPPRVSPRRTASSLTWLAFLSFTRSVSDSSYQE